MPSVKRTTPPEKYVMLYDGHCVFCDEQSKRLERLARPGSVERVSFQDPGALDRFPGLTFDECMEALHVVAPDGRVYRGVEAIVQTLKTRRVLGLLASGYYLPVVRQVADWAYRKIAERRYEIMGKKVAAGECDGGSCSLHFRPAGKDASS